MLSRKALEDFKKIWRKQFGENISDNEAAEEGINLLTMFNAIYRPINNAQAEERTKRHTGDVEPPSAWTAEFQ